MLTRRGNSLGEEENEGDIGSMRSCSRCCLVRETLLETLSLGLPRLNSACPRGRGSSQSEGGHSVAPWRGGSAAAADLRPKSAAH